MAMLMVLLTGAAPPPAKDPVPVPPLSAPADRVDTAVQAGVAFLLSQQQPTGAIADAVKYQTALTSFAALALVGAGHSPQDKTPEGIALRRAIYFILRADRQTADGYFGSADTSLMYGHAVTTLLLCELLRTATDPEQEQLIRRKAEAAHKFILRAQASPKASPTQDYGGWRYQPNAGDSDVPVTAWQLLALHVGVKAGFSVPPRNGLAAAGYLKRVYAAGYGQFDYGPKPVLVAPATQARSETETRIVKQVYRREFYLDPNYRVGYCYRCHFDPKTSTNVVTYYTPPSPNLYRPPDTVLQPAGPRNNFSTSAMGLLGLRICGQPNAPEAAAAANLLLEYMRSDPQAKAIAACAWPFHGTFFNTLALHRYGEPHATTAQQFAERNFVVGQSPDGAWTDTFEGRQIGRVYCTSLALLSLEAKYRRLGMYEPP